MTHRLLTRSIQNLSVVVGATLLLAVPFLPVQAISLVTQRNELSANDKIDWGSLDFGASIEIVPGTIAKFCLTLL